LIGFTMLTTMSCWFFSMLTVYQPYGCHFKRRERHFSLCFYLRDVVSEFRRRKEGLWSFFRITLEFFFFSCSFLFSQVMHFAIALGCTITKLTPKWIN
jgi:hypothetical protein